MIVGTWPNEETENLDYILYPVCMTDSDVQVEELEEILSPLNKEQKTDWKTKIQALIHVIFIVTYLYYLLSSTLLQALT